MRHSPLFLVFLVPVLLSAVEQTDPGLLPVDPRWDHPRFLTNRPRPGQVVTVNPPRLSWSYLLEVVPGGERAHAAVEFRLQIADNARFRRPLVDVTTDFNWYNALPVLKPGQWFWRVRSSGEKTWRPSVPFTVPAKTPEWDRRALNGIAKDIARNKRPRLGPKLAGHRTWSAWQTGQLRFAHLLGQ